MLEVGKQSQEFFALEISDAGQKNWRLKSLEQYCADRKVTEQPSKKYFTATTLPEIIKQYPVLRKGLKESDLQKGILPIPGSVELFSCNCAEQQNRIAFIDFVQGLLNLNPIERWSPQQAKLHPFITGEKFTGPFSVCHILFHTRAILMGLAKYIGEHKISSDGDIIRERSTKSTCSADEPTAWASCEVLYPCCSATTYKTFDDGV